jgi:hypothetical protein
MSRLRLSKAWDLLLSVLFVVDYNILLRLLTTMYRAVHSVFE